MPLANVAGSSKSIQTSNIDSGAALDIDAGGNVTIDSESAVSIDSKDDSNLTVTGSGKDLEIAVAGGGAQELKLASAGTGENAISIDTTTGSIAIGASLANEKTLKLGQSGATQMVFTPHGTAGLEKISLTNTSGSDPDAIKLLSTAGGITIDAGSGTVTFADNGVTLGTITSGAWSGTATGVSGSQTAITSIFHENLDIGSDSATSGMHIDFSEEDEINIFADTTAMYTFDNAGNFHCDSDMTCFSSNTGSDKRLKKNIKDINYGLKDILNLRGVEFDWKEKRNGKHDIGFIAQEVQEVIPEVINEIPDLKGENNKYLGVDYSKIVPILVESMKEQQKQIEELKNQIKLLKI